MSNSIFASPTSSVAYSPSSAFSPSSFFSILWSKICEVSTRIFNSLFFWRKPTVKLSEKQIRLIDNIKTKPTRYFVPKQTTPIPIQNPQPPTTVNVASQTPLRESDKIYNPSLEELRTCFKEIAGISSELVYEKQFAGIVKLVKGQTSEIPDLLNFIATLICQIGNKASQNFFKRNGAKAQRSEAVSPYIKTLMTSLLKTTTSQALRLTLESQLDERISKMSPPVKLPLNQSLKMYSKPILDEFFNTAAKESPLKIDELFLNENFSPDFKTIDIVFETAARLLVEVKIKHFLGTLHSSMLTNLDGILSKTIKLNAQKITDIMVCRAADLLNNMSYQATFDKFITILNQQAESIVTAEKVVDDLIAKTKLPDSTKFEPDQKERILTARKEIHSLGEQKYKQMKITQAFAAEKGCHPIISNMIHLEEHDLDTIEEITSSDMADDFIKLFLPKKKVLVEGKVVELDGIDYLWQQLEFPPELSNLLDQLKELIDKTMASDTAKSFTGLKLPLYRFIENIAVSYVQEKAKSHLTGAIKALLKETANPTLIKGLVGEKLAPTALGAMIPLFTQLVISEEIDKIVPLFKLSIDSLTSNDTTETLLKTLCELTQAKAYYYTQAGNTITLLKFKETSLPLVEDIKKVLLTCRQTEEAENNAILSKIQSTMLTSFKFACAQFVENNKQADVQAYGILTKYIEELPKQLEAVDQFKKDLIITKLKEKLKPIFVKVKEAGSQPHESKVATLITPFFDEIKELLHAKNVSSETIKAQLNQYLATTKIKDAPEVYGNLMINLAFNLGKFEVMGLAGSLVNAETVKGYMKETMGEILFKLIAKFRKGYEEPVKLLTKTVTETIGSKEKLGQLLEIKPATAQKDPKEIETTFQEELKKASALTFDILNKAIDLNIGSMNPLRGIVKGALGYDPSQIKKVAINCFEKLSQNKLFLENMILRMTDAMIMAMNEADSKLKAKQQPLTNTPPTNPIAI